MIQRFSSLVSSGVPCFFYTDFSGEHFNSFTLDELEHEDIEFAFNSGSNATNTPHKPYFTPIPIEQYRQKFEAVQEHIRNGNTYLLNLTQPTSI